MHNYEIMLVIQPDLEETVFNTLLEKVNGWIAETGGSVTKTDLWGKRRLANKIRKISEGVYVLLEAQMPPAATRDLERNLNLSEPVMRFLIITEK
ncbi:MAG: 30S ribosomal protein S6 [Anaerolineaceae bacterium]|nr:30S ribosomal protein S6 [Anaerolineaceae bacterium]